MSAPTSAVVGAVGVPAPLSGPVTRRQVTCKVIGTVVGAAPPTGGIWTSPVPEPVAGPPVGLTWAVSDMALMSLVPPVTVTVSG